MDTDVQGAPNGGMETVDLIAGWIAAPYPDGPEHDGALPVTPDAGWFAIEVPGAIQYDLIRAGRARNPYAGSQAVQAIGWVHQSDWLLRNTITIPRQDPADCAHFLEFDGVDTFTEIWLNGVSLGTTANAYRGYRFEIPRGLLTPGENALLVHLKAHARMVTDLVPEAQRRMGPTFRLKNLIRRYQRNFFSGSSLLNLGGEVLGIGLYKPVRLRLRPEARIENVHFEVRGATPAHGAADVHVRLSPQAADPDRRVEVSLWHEAEARCVATASAVASGDALTLRLDVEQPRRWWPRGYGEAALYRLDVELVGDDKPIDSFSCGVGFRTVELRRKTKSGRESFQFVVNGTPIHIRGHNLVPIDYIKVHGEPAAYDRLLRLMCEGNSNMLRIWGGGAIESPGFYEACDTLGILLWQDFYLHSTTYPDYDAAWVAQLKLECEELLLQVRNHPSLALICGGNEQYEGWDEWGWRGVIDRFYGEPLVVDVLRRVSAEFCPELPYIVNSPHDGISSQTPVIGDGHVWGNFYNATKDPLFVTETCWSQESYSRPETLARMMDLDVDSLSGVGWPNAWKELTGLNLIGRMPYTGGPLDTSSLRNYLLGLELEQAVADHHALSQFRHHSPSCNGILYWSLNKGGPLFQFGCVDYLGYPLASFYVTKRIFADVAVHAWRDVNDIRVAASNLRQAAVAARLLVTHVRADGTEIRRWEREASLDAVASTRLLDLSGYYAEIIDRTREVIHVQLAVDGETVSRETLFFCPLIDFAVAPNTIDVDMERADDGSCRVALRARSVVKMVWIESNQKLLADDNYFAMVPGESRTIDAGVLERTTNAPTLISVRAMNSEERHDLPLRSIRDA